MGKWAGKVLALVATICLAWSVEISIAETELDIEELMVAAEQGDVDAQLQLGVMYARGKDVAVNEVKAYAWSSLAADQGEELAARHRDAIAARLTTESLKRAQDLAAKLQAKIVTQKKQPPSLRFWPSSQSSIAHHPSLASWVKSLKPAAGKH